jgi:cytochrome c556
MHRLARNALPAAVAAATVLLAAPASAQFAKPEDAIKYRRSVMTVMATHFGRVAAMANGKIPYDAKAAADNAALAVTMSQLPFVAFLPGTDKGETRAEAKIWSEPDKFKQGAEQMQAAMQKVDAAAKANNLDALKAAVGDTGKACKSCHDSYRKEQ